MKIQLFQPYRSFVTFWHHAGQGSPHRTPMVNAAPGVTIPGRVQSRTFKSHAAGDVVPPYTMIIGVCAIQIGLQMPFAPVCIDAQSVLRSAKSPSLHAAAHTSARG